MSTRKEFAHSVLGVAGRMYPRHAWDNARWSAQKWISEARAITGYGAGGKIQVEIRFDDECRNGHNSFAITATVTTPESLRRRDCVAGGCLHEEIARVFPELAPLIRWHLTSTDGPMHYIANVVYLAGDLDCNGLRAGERRQIRNGRSGLPSWKLEKIPADAPMYIDSTTEPEAPAMRYVPWERTGEGKARELDAARTAACWPDATDAELSVPREQLEAALRARLPALLAEFRAAMDGAGFAWAPSDVPA